MSKEWSRMTLLKEILNIFYIPVGVVVVLWLDNTTPAYLLQLKCFRIWDFGFKFLNWTFWDVSRFVPVKYLLLATIYTHNFCVWSAGPAAFRNFT